MPPTTATPDPAELDDLFPSGVAHVTDLQAVGMTRPAIARCCREHGPWRRLLPGVVLLSGAPPSRRQQVAAGLLACGPDSMVTGLDVLLGYGIAGLRPAATRAPVHLLVPHQRRRLGTHPLLVERTRRLPAPLLINGLSYAPLTRAVLDAVRRMRRRTDVRSLLGEVVQRGLCRPDVLRAELDAGSSRGAMLPRRVLAELTTIAPGCWLPPADCSADLGHQLVRELRRDRVATPRPATR
jgi:hypothetical protein